MWKWENDIRRTYNTSLKLIVWYPSDRAKMQNTIVIFIFGMWLKEILQAQEIFQQITV
jgi:hypothetical protein